MSSASLSNCFTSYAQGALISTLLKLLHRIIRSRFGHRADLNILTERLRDLESEIRRLQKGVASYRPVEIADAARDVRSVVTKALLSGRGLLMIQ